MDYVFKKGDIVKIKNYYRDVEFRVQGKALKVPPAHIEGILKPNIYVIYNEYENPMRREIEGDKLILIRSESKPESAED